MNINILLFNDFETLDAFGPIEVFGRVAEFTLNYYSILGGAITSSHDSEIVTLPICEADKSGVLVVPGGMGTRTLAHDEPFLSAVAPYIKGCEFCLSICTGSAILAKCGALDGRRATSNKQAFDWVKTTGAQVNWADSARWCVDGKFYTASGISAGIDMALGFVADLFGTPRAEKIACDIEYIWNSDRENDAFAR